MEGSADRVRSSYYDKLYQIKAHKTSGNGSGSPDSGKKGRPLPVPPPIIPKKESTSDDTPVVEAGEKVLEKFEHPSSEERTGYDLRLKYLHTLAKTGVWPSAWDKPKTHQTVIIFDWDDTLLCTSYLNPSGVGEGAPVITELARSYLKELEPAVVIFLFDWHHRNRSRF